jgi:hypothetical protein
MVIVSCASVRTNNRGTPRPSVSPAIRLCTLATPGRHIGKRRAKRNTPPQWECAAENSRPIELYSNQTSPKLGGGPQAKSTSQLAILARVSYANGENTSVNRWASLLGCGYVNPAVSKSARLWASQPGYGLVNPAMSKSARLWASQPGYGLVNPAMG